MSGALPADNGRMLASAKTHEVEIGGRRVRLTNLEKEIFPSGYTKGQVIDYYIRISDYLLPHVRDRAVTLKRFPNGVRAPHFYEKDAPRFKPPWVQTFGVPRRSGKAEICYVLLNDLPSLVWSANSANLEIHPFLSRVPRIERPTSVVFDLDPGEGTDILTCGEIAMLLRERLTAQRLECFAKVSGSKGLQLYVPLNTPVTYEETQPFAKGLAESLAREHPGRVIATMAKVDRKGKVFIDWSQNSDFKTTVCVYSMRAKSDSPFISMPVTWEELRRALRKGDSSSLRFDPEACFKRLAKTGDLFEPVLRLKQKIRHVNTVNALQKKSGKYLKSDNKMAE